MRRTPFILSAVFLIGLTFLFFDAIADLWPAVGVQGDVCAQVASMTGPAKGEFTEAIKKAYKISCRTHNIPVTRVNVEGMRMALSPDQALYAIVALVAALGALVQSMRLLFFPAAGAAGDVALAWNLIRPFAAMALALVVYVCIRALFLPAGNLAQTNPYGFLAVAALVGLFIDQILGALGRPLKRTSG